MKASFSNKTKTFKAGFGNSSGGNGITFIPSIDENGVLSWTNNGGLNNPEPIMIFGEDGAPGKDGVSIANTYVEYSIGRNAEMGWTTDFPEVQKGQYLWTRITIILSDGRSQKAYSLSYLGEDGKVFVDEELSKDSINPVQNKVITEKFEEVDNELQRITEEFEQSVTENINNINEDIDMINKSIGDINKKAEEFEQSVTENINNINEDIDNLAPVAKSNDYNDLNNIPDIPSIEGLATEEYVDGRTDEKLDKTGGTIDGDLTVTGDLTVSGRTITEEHETLVVEDNMVVLNSNKTDLQAEKSGIAINKNVDSTYGAVYDPIDDTFKFGEGTLNEANEFEFNDGEGLPFAVREDSTQFTDGHLVEWSADGNKLVDSGKTVEDFSLDGHGHIIDDVEKLQETLDTKAILGEELINTDVAYIKDVPATSAPYAALSKVGGMTRKCTNLFDLNTLVITGSNTYTKNAEAGRVTVKFTGVHSPLRWRIKVPKNTTLTLGFDSYSGANATVQISDTLQIPSGSAETIDGKISLGTGLKSISVNTGNYNELTVSIYIPAGSDFDVDIVGLRVNESNSLLPFEPYFGGLRDTKVTAVKSVGRNHMPYPYISNSNTYNDVVWKVNTDGTVVANGTANGGNSILNLHNPISLPQGDYHIYANDGNKLPLGCVIVVYKNGEYIGEANDVFSFSVTSNDKLRIYLQVVNGVTVNNAIFKPMIAKSITPYVPYTEHTLVIPEALISKEWYGMGVPNTEGYNSVDFTNGKAYIKAKKYVFTGDEPWMMENAPKPYFYLSVGEYGDVIANAVICNTYKQNTIGKSNENIGINVINSSGYNDARIIIRPEGNLTSVAAWKNKLLELKMSNNHLTAIIGFTKIQTEDISNLITDDNLIGVEGGGTLTFENEYGYGVPSEVIFYLNNNDIISANEFVGNLVGTAKKAEFAERDSQGNVIVNTYFSKDNLKFVTNSDAKQYKVQADKNGNLFVNVPWQGGGEGADGNYYHIPDFPSGSGIKIGTGSGVADMYVPVDSSLSDDSVYPVQNKVVKAALDNKLSTQGGRIYSGNHTSNTPLDVMANNADCYIGYYNKEAIGLGWIGFDSTFTPKIYTSGGGYTTILHTGNAVNLLQLKGTYDATAQRLTLTIDKI